MDVVSWYTYLVENDFDVSDSLSMAVYGHGPEDRPEAFASRQAVTVAADIAVPVLLQQGGADRTVPPFQARLMARALEEEGRVEVLLREYPLLGHAFWFWDNPESHTRRELEQAEEAWADFTAFLAEQLGGPSTDD
jgi:dienelactone hydrolase